MDYFKLGVLLVSLLGLAVALLLGLRALRCRPQRGRLLRGAMSVLLATAAVLSGLWSLGLLWRATAPVSEGATRCVTQDLNSVYALKLGDATIRW